MAWDKMNVSPAEQGRQDTTVYEKEINLASVTISAWTLVPKDVNELTYILSVAGGGKGKVQITNSSVNTIKTGSPVAMDWPSGEIAVNTSDSSKRVNAFRLNQTFAGTTKLEVVTSN